MTASGEFLKREMEAGVVRVTLKPPKACQCGRLPKLWMEVAGFTLQCLCGKVAWGETQFDVSKNWNEN